MTSGLVLRKNFRGKPVAEPSVPRRVFLLRHAKSSWDSEGDDHDRDLAPRGRQAADRMAAYLQAENIAPALVLCSTARRARETLARVVPALHGTGRIEFEEGLYLASGGAMLRRLRRLDDDVASVMLVGHNPGMQELALLLGEHGDEDMLRRLRSKYPTGGLAEIAVNCRHWRDLGAEQGTLVRFVVPRDLS